MPPSAETRADSDVAGAWVRGTLPALDTMRAIAAVAVVATHASFWGGAYAHRGYGTALARLDIGVAIFFVLSGFLLSRPWFEHYARGTTPPRTRVYLWHRLLRIYPVYVIAAAAALIVLPGNDDASFSTYLHTLTLTNIYLDDRLPDGLTQMWSLATEVAFYLMLPLLMWLMLSRRRGGGQAGSRLGVVLAIMVAANMLWVLATTTWFDTTGTMASTWLPGFLSWFGVGMLLASAAVRLESGDDAAGSDRWAAVLRQMGRSPGSCWVAGLALFAVAATPLGGPASLTAPLASAVVTKSILYAVIAGLLILPGVFADPDGRYIRVLSLPVLRHLGFISYGIFCVHLLILEEVARWRDMQLFAGRTLELFAITLVITIAVSEVLYRVVERPALRWKKRFDRTGPSTSVTATPRPASTRS